MENTNSAAIFFLQKYEESSISPASTTAQEKTKHTHFVLLQNGGDMWQQIKALFGSRWHFLIISSIHPIFILHSKIKINQWTKETHHKGKSESLETTKKNETIKTIASEGKENEKTKQIADLSQD